MNKNLLEGKQITFRRNSNKEFVAAVGKNIECRYPSDVRGFYTSVSGKLIKVGGKNLWLDDMGTERIVWIPSIDEAVIKD